MNFVVYLINGHTLTISQEEMEKLIGSTGLVAISSIGEVVNTSSISHIVPESRARELERPKIDRSKQMDGMLMSGQRVVKVFGQWMLADGERDERGNPCIRPDPDHYKELRMGILPTPDEYYNHGFDKMDMDEWTAALCDGDDETPMLEPGNRSSNDLKKLSFSDNNCFDKLPYYWPK